MIPRANLIAWQQYAPWIDDLQIEQDLILSRMLTDIFNNPFLSQSLAFRGGTAIHKLLFTEPSRYSEDIDLVQIQPGPIGKIVNAIRDCIDPWLGTPSYKRTQGRFVLYYKFTPENIDGLNKKIKIEINTREHFSVYGLAQRKFSVENPWCSANTIITSFTSEELLATKFRALYQRKKGRDLFDLYHALRTLPNIVPSKLIHAFKIYTEFNDQKISRNIFEANLNEKCKDKAFTGDVLPLLTIQESSRYDPLAAAKVVHATLILQLP